MIIRTGDAEPARGYAIALGVLAVAFLGRVVGQIVVALFSPDFLPPMEEWYSGLLPYKFLLPSQLLILAFQFEVSRQLWVGRGVLASKTPSLGGVLKWFSLVYFLAMAARFLWFGASIPVFFHWVLAAYVYVLSRHFRGL